MSEVKVTKCPPGVAEGAVFQRYAWHRHAFASIVSSCRDDVNPAPDEPSPRSTLLEEFSASALSLRDIITGDDGD